MTITIHFPPFQWYSFALGLALGLGLMGIVAWWALKMLADAIPTHLSNI